MPPRLLILASASPARASLLRAAGIEITVQPARIDEDGARRSLVAEAAPARDIADALAEMKARKVAERNPEDVVLGCDQVLEFQGEVWGKVPSAGAALAQLQALRGQTHLLHSAAVLYDRTVPVWRHTEDVRMTMRNFSDEYLEGYVARNWESIRHSAGSYKIEEEGVRLFARMDGDYFSVLGLPLLPVLDGLARLGHIVS